MPGFDKLDVINQGLVRIGAAPIAALNEQGASGVTADVLFDVVAQDEMAGSPWSFALREKVLPQLVLAEEDLRLLDYRYVYQMPGDVLRIWGVKDSGPYRLAGDQLYTDSASAVLVYNADVPPSTWPAYFVNLVAVKFAEAAAIPITDSANRQTLYSGLAARMRGRAMTIDSQQVPPWVYDLIRIYTRRTHNPLASA